MLYNTNKLLYADQKGTVQEYILEKRLGNLNYSKNKYANSNAEISSALSGRGGDALYFQTCLTRTDFDVWKFVPKK